MTSRERVKAAMHYQPVDRPPVQFYYCPVGYYEHGDKLKVITADAIAYMEGVKDGDFDFCFADIWEGAVDGAEAYKKLRPYEKKLPHTEFAYWIEEQIKAYLEE